MMKAYLPARCHAASFGKHGLLTFCRYQDGRPHHTLCTCCLFYPNLLVQDWKIVTYEDQWCNKYSLQSIGKSPVPVPCSHKAHIIQQEGRFHAISDIKQSATVINKYVIQSLTYFLCPRLRHYLKLWGILHWRPTAPLDCLFFSWLGLPRASLWHILTNTLVLSGDPAAVAVTFNTCPTGNIYRLS